MWTICRSIGSSSETSTRTSVFDVEIRHNSPRPWITGGQIAQHDVRRPGRRRVTEGTMDKKWWTLLAVCAGIFMLLLDVTIVVVAQPAIQEGLHASFTDVQWVLDAYALTLA